MIFFNTSMCYHFNVIQMLYKLHCVTSILKLPANKAIQNKKIIKGFLRDYFLVEIAVPSCGRQVIDSEHSVM